MNGVNEKNQATSKVISPSTFIPESYTHLQLHERAFLGTPYFSLF